MLNRTQFYDECRTKIRAISAERNVEQTAAITALGEADNIFALGLIDSLSAVDLIDFVERALDIEIEVENYNPSTFYTMQSMYDTFSPIAVGTQT